MRRGARLGIRQAWRSVIYCACALAVCKQASWQPVSAPLGSYSPVFPPSLSLLPVGVGQLYTPTVSGLGGVGSIYPSFQLAPSNHPELPGGDKAELRQLWGRVLPASGGMLHPGHTPPNPLPRGFGGIARQQYYTCRNINNHHA